MSDAPWWLWLVIVAIAIGINVLVWGGLLLLEARLSQPRPPSRAWIRISNRLWR